MPRQKAYYIVKRLERFNPDFKKFTAGAMLALLCLAPAVRAQSEVRGELANEPLVDVSKIDPAIVIDLRYAGPHNITGHPIYPAGSLCLLRRGVAEQLKLAQAYLRALGYNLKIWDAWRPAAAQQILWDHEPNPEVVASPAKGGSRHTWGVAVDVSLVDLIGQDVPMPTDFDDFTDAAKSEYKGVDPIVAKNLGILKKAMEIAGFEGMRDEWWHFSAKNWRSYKAIPSLDLQPQQQSVAAASPSPGPSPNPSPAVEGTLVPAIQTGTLPQSTTVTPPSSR